MDARDLDPAERQRLVRALLARSVPPAPVTPRPRGTPAPLSPAQRRLWFVHQLDDHSPAMNLPFALRLRGLLDRAALTRSLDAVVARHDLTRTRFSVNGDAPVQIADLPPPVLGFLDLGPVAAGDRETAAVRAAHDLAIESFDLERGPVVRMRLMRLADDDHLLAVCIPHILCDGWSLGILLHEVGAVYNAAVAGKAAVLPPLEWQYGDLAAAQAHRPASTAELDYWARTLDAAPVLDLPVDRRRPPRWTETGRQCGFTIDPEVVDRLRAIARSANVTLFVALLTVLRSLLARYSRQSDICIGTAVANRDPESVSVAGFFVNTVVLRTVVPEGASFRKALHCVGETVVAALGHSTVPFEQVVDRVRPIRDPSRSPLFDVMLLLQPDPLEHLKLTGLQVTTQPVHTATARYDLTIEFTEVGAGLAGVIEYRSDLFDQARIDALIGHFGVLLARVAADPEEVVDDINILTPNERRRVIDWNATATEELFRSVPAAILEQAQQHPDRLAARAGTVELTYGALVAEASHIAAALGRLDLGPEDVIGIRARRGLPYLSALLGVELAGCAYLPLDQRQPQSRADRMVAHSGCRLVLDDELIGAIRADCDPESGVVAPLRYWHPKSLAYVIYTSGSTGEPKAVMIEHAGMSNHMRAKIDDLGLRADDVVLQNGPPSFDISIWQFLAPLIVGAVVEIVDDTTAIDGTELLKVVDERGVTVLQVVPAVMRELLDSGASRAGRTPPLRSLRWLVPTGDALPVELCERWFDAYPDVPILNTYGSTECSDDQCHLVVQPSAASDDPSGVVNLGHPIRNMRAYVLDSNLGVVPVGVPGELHLAGIGLGRGYLADPRRTADKFRPDPFGIEPGARLYRTSDVVRWRTDGAIDFVGRFDNIVKIDGIRVELAEVEATIRLHSDVLDCAVVVTRGQSGRAALAAHVVLACPIDDGDVGPELTALLAEHLPSAMIPRAFLFSRTLPVNANGKLDRQALPPVTVEDGRRDRDRPRTATEHALAGLWCDLLEVERVGAYDNFFDLGGHSLLAMRLLNRVRRELDAPLVIRDVLEAVDLRALAAAVAAARSEESAGPLKAPNAIVSPGRPAKPELASPAQNRMWFLDQYEPGSAAYIIYQQVRLRGPLDVAALAGALDQLAARHAVLRTTYHLVDGVVRAVEHAAGPELSFVDQTGVGDAEIEQLAGAECRRPFDLSAGPIMRALLIRRAADDHLLVLSLHHIAADGWSLGIITAELAAAYCGGDREPVGPSYLELARASLARASAGDLDYWRERLRDAPRFELPRRTDAAGLDPSAGAIEALVLDAATTDALGAVARAESSTIFVALVTVLHILLGRYGAGDDVCIGTPAANRDLDGAEGVIGLFVNTVVLRTDMSGDPSFRRALARMRDTVREAIEHAHTPYEQLVDEVTPDRSANLFSVMFAIQDGDLAIPVLPDLTVELVDSHNGSAKFDLSISVTVDTTGVRGSIEYRSAAFTADFASDFARHFGALACAAGADPDCPLSELTALDADEFALVMDAGCGPQRAWPDPALVPEQIRRRCRETPDAVAVSWDAGELTYRELDHRAERLAARLQQSGVGPEKLVGVRLDRSPELIVALVAVLYSGAAYLPIDVSDPIDSVSQRLAAAGVELLVTQAATPVVGSSITVVSPTNIETGPVFAPVASDGCNAAYAIFTSGSTGEPKLVVNTHAGLRNRLNWMQDEMVLTAADRVVQKTPYTFDVSVWEFFWPLSRGARIVLAAPGAHRDPTAIAELIRAKRVTVAHFVPSMLRRFVAIPAAARIDSLRLVVASGEELDAALARRCIDVVGARLYNLYGPTEAAIDVTAEPVSADEDAPLPIGRPIANLAVYVLDHNLSPVPSMVTGELYLAGAGLARGYHCRPDLTAERFIPSPWGAPGERMYRTGDRGRRRPDGRLDYLGRTDRQLKVRGARVEPGETEGTLRRLPGVLDAAVKSEPVRGEIALVAYVVLDAGVSWNPQAMAAQLRNQLSGQAVPTLFERLDCLPTTVSGKLDRVALPAPASAAVDSEQQPTGLVEITLCRIWADALGLAHVGADDNFFTIGGDSIRAVGVISSARAAGLSIALPAIFAHKTVRALAGCTAGDCTVPAHRPLPDPDRGNPFALISDLDRARLPSDVVDAYPLSTMQAGMIFDSEYAVDFAVYHDVSRMTVAGRFNRAALESAAAMVVSRHPALRTSIDLDGFTEPLQLVHAQAQVPISVVDLGALSRDQREQLIQVAAVQEQSAPFAWDRPPLLRLKVHTYDADTFHLVLSCHNVLLDGWSYATLLTELLEGYLRAVRNEDPDEDNRDGPPGNALREFIELERATIRDPGALEFWRTQLASGAATPLAGRTAPSVQTKSSVRTRAARRHQIDAAGTAGLRRLAADAGVPLKSVLLAAHLYVQGVFVGPSTGLTGLVTNGRPEVEGADRALGLFLNVVPLPTRTEAPTWRGLVELAFSAELALLPYRRMPTARMTYGDGAPLQFDTVFNFVHFHLYESVIERAGRNLVDFETFDDTRFRLWCEFSVNATNDDVSVELVYDRSDLTDLFIDSLMSLYKRVLTAMATDPASEPATLDLAHMVSGATPLKGPADENVILAFEAQARLTPDRVALRAGDQMIDFATLDRHANKLARRLVHSGAGAEVMVATLLPRSIDLVIATIAVLKAGAAVVVLDIESPPGRIETLLALCGAQILIAGPQAPPLVTTAQRVAPTAWPTTDDGDVLSLERNTHPESAAAVLFTSGSTGPPKPVVLVHRQLSHRFAWMREQFPFATDERTCYRATAGVIDSLWEMLGGLAQGIELVIVDEASGRDPIALSRILIQAQVTRCWAAPTMLRVLLDANLDFDGLRCVRLWFATGEALPLELSARFAQRLGPAVLYNLYGTSESWDSNLAVSGRPTEPGDTTEPIGPSIAGVATYVLDTQRRELPAGAVGELYVGGLGLGRGYLGEPRMTAERFEPDPLSPVAGARRYRTGDLARRNADGTIHCLGRIDRLQSVRGHRVEPLEVEAILRRHSDVRDVVVTALDSATGSKVLAAFVVAATAALDAGDLRRLAREQLPAHLRPSRYLFVDELPSLAAGKRQVPAAPGTDDASGSTAFAAPRLLSVMSEDEQVIAILVGEVLECADVGPDADFFDLGGDSLSAMVLAARISRAFAIDVPVRAIFDTSTVAELTGWIRAQSGRALREPILAVTRRGPAPASRAQQRLWLASELSDDSAAYNVHVAARLRGPVRTDLMLAALHSLMVRHEELRASFVFEAGELIERINEDATFERVHTVDRSESGLAALAEAAVRRPFDLERGPLGRVLLEPVEHAPDEHVLAVVVHHIVCDAWSLGVLAGELGVLYEALLSGAEADLTELPVTYADYTAWMGSRLDHDGAAAAFWRTALVGAPATLELGPAPGGPTRGEVRAALLDAVGTQALTRLSARHGGTLFMGLLTAFAIVLSHDAATDDLVIGTDVAGRDDPQLAGVVGFFVNQLALRIHLRGASDFATLLERVREITLAAFEHRDLPFDDVLRLVAPDRADGHSPLFRVKLVLQNAPAQPLDLRGVAIGDYSVDSGVAQLDLNLRAAPTSAGLVLSAQYRADRISGERVERLLRHLNALLARVCAEPHTSLAQMYLMLDELRRTEAERAASMLFDDVEARLRQARRRPV